MIFQKTLKNKTTLDGKGLHTGSPCRLTFHPAEENHGVVFRKNGHTIPADYKYVINTRRAITLDDGKISIRTVEHLLSAVSGMRLTNLMIDINGPEIPVMDGSAKPFCDLLMNAGMTEQPCPAKIISIDRTVMYINPGNGNRITLTPHEGFKVTYTLRYGEKPMDTFSVDLPSDNYVELISRARTFCFIKDLEQLYGQDLIRGAEMESGFVVIDEEGRLDLLKKRFNLSDDESWLRNTRPFRTASLLPPVYENEMTRHKILDIIGDFSLYGAFINAHVTTCGTGHFENIELLKMICK